MINTAGTELDEFFDYGNILYLFSVTLGYKNMNFKFIDTGEIKGIKNEPLDIEWLNGIHINKSFFENVGVRLDLNKIVNRSYWEKENTNCIEETDLNDFLETIYNIDDKYLHDEYLYMFYSRKSTSLSIEQTKKIYLIKVKKLTNIIIYDKEKTRLNCIDINIYLLLKKFNDNNEFSPIVTLCAIIEPSEKYSDKDKIKILLNDMKEFPNLMIDLHDSINGDYYRDIGTFVKLESTDKVSIDSFILYIVSKEFISKLNSYLNINIRPILMPHPYIKKANKIYIKKSRPFISWTLAFNSRSEYTIDPLHNYKSNDITLDSLKFMILNMLYSTDYILEKDEKIHASEIFSAERFKQKIDKIDTYNYIDTTIYSVSGASVTILNYNSFKKSIDEYWKNTNNNHDYNYNLQGPKWSIAWDMLMYSMIASQELLFTIYDERLDSRNNIKKSKIKSQKEIMETASNDFENLFDLDITNHDCKSFRQEFELSKRINSTDSYYIKIKEKLSLMNSEIIKEQNTNTILAIFIAIIIGIATIVVTIHYH
jgi:hypothetical protein